MTLPDPYAGCKKCGLRPCQCQRFAWERRIEKLEALAAAARAFVRDGGSEALRRMTLDLARLDYNEAAQDDAQRERTKAVNNPRIPITAIQFPNSPGPWRGDGTLVFVDGQPSYIIWHVQEGDGVVQRIVPFAAVAHVRPEIYLST